MNISEERSALHPRMLVTITRVEDGGRLERLLEEEQIPILYQCRGKGTAPSEIMDIFGLSGTTRLVMAAFLTKERTGDVMKAMEHRLTFRQKGGGIAISIPMTGLQTHMFNLLKEEAEDEMVKHVEEMPQEDTERTENGVEYTLIWTSVSAGYSDDVVNAARKAGARGGTILKGRRSNSGKVSQLLGISRQEEQEFVMIVAPKAQKREIMAAINQACGLGTDAHGTVLSLPVDQAIGLET